jgi:hypothetical protein
MKTIKIKTAFFIIFRIPQRIDQSTHRKLWIIDSWRWKRVVCGCKKGRRRRLGFRMRKSHTYFMGVEGLRRFQTMSQDFVSEKVLRSIATPCAAVLSSLI